MERVTVLCKLHAPQFLYRPAKISRRRLFLVCLKFKQCHRTCVGCSRCCAARALYESAACICGANGLQTCGLDRLVTSSGRPALPRRKVSFAVASFLDLTSTSTPQSAIHIYTHCRTRHRRLNPLPLAQRCVGHIRVLEMASLEGLPSERRLTTDVLRSGPAARLRPSLFDT